MRQPTRALVDAAKQCDVQPVLWLQMSSLAVYGDAGQEIIDEQHPPADGPRQMAGVARPWEEAAEHAPAATLRAELGRPWSPPTPKPLVHLGALFLRTDPALALTGPRCVPKRLLDAGFEFDHPTFSDAVADLVRTRAA